MFTKKFTSTLSVYQRIYYHFLLCANICSMHGFTHVVRKGISPYERVLWIIIIICAVGLCVPIGIEAWTHYQFRPTVISLEKDHYTWNTTLPAFTFCTDFVDEEKVAELINNLTISENDTNDFIIFLQNLATGNIEGNFDNNKYINNPLYENGENYLDWILKTRAPFDYTLSNTFDGPDGEFEMVITYASGICYTYNSNIAIYNNPRLWSLKSEDLPVQEPIEVNPSLPAPTIMVLGISTPYTVYFHASGEIPDINGYKFQTSTSTYFRLQIEIVWTPSEVKDLKISQRKCRFPDESNLKHSPVYTYNLCRKECRIQLCLKLCKCIPYYYKRLENEPSCNPIGMKCLMKHKKEIHKLVDENNKKICSCLQTCDFYNIVVTDMESMEWFLSTDLQWSIPKYPTIRYKRSLIFTFTNLLVQIGGVAGLMLGFSVLSLIEICFFFTLRFYWAVFRSRLLKV